MLENNSLGYKKIFGIILPDWITEKMVKNTLLGVLSMVVMSVLLTLVIFPKKEEIKILEDKLNTENEKLVSLTKSNEGINVFENILTEQEMDRILSAMPLDYSPEKTIYVLRSVAADSGVSIVSYSLPSGVIVDNDETKTKKNSSNMVDFSNYVIKLSVSAPVDDLLRFVSKVESSLPFGLVSDLNLQEVTKLTKSSDGKNVQMAMELKYFQAKVNQININNITTLSDSNIKYSKLLNGFNLFLIPEEIVSSNEDSSGSGELFGF